jgi:hypothetical protein
MTIKEKIIEEIEKIPEQNLDELYNLVKEFEEKNSEPTLMEQLRKIKISATPDFSVNANLYPTVEL